MVAMLAASQIADGAITCGRVASGIAPCLGYIRGMAPLTPACCGGIKSLNAAASSTVDRQAACRCLKSAASGVRGINYGLAGGLPGKCGVNVGFPISQSVNCAT
uniref:Non-specific lipid-transfer protein n=1 Tax=Linum usitatissimum TaxID=4006 RepID=R9ULR6_LINUS|nr:non-specific lipid transfer protein 3 [Linum usitatissimum]